MLHNYKQNSYSENINSMYEKLEKYYQNYPDCSDWLGEDTNFPESFDLDNENITDFKFKQHILVFGNLER